MKKEVQIWINSKTVSGGETVPIELYSKGSFYKKNGTYFITYDETDEYGSVMGQSIIKLTENNRFSLLRAKSASSMTMEEGKRTLCRYEVDGNELFFGIETDYVKNNLDDNGGNVGVKYRLDVNGELLNDVTIEIKVKTKIERNNLI